MSTKKELTPPDRERCQAEITTRPSPWTMGGDLNPKTERCASKATRIVTEKNPGSDGRCGAMSVCDDCFEVLTRNFQGRMGQMFFVEVLPANTQDGAA